MILNENHTLLSVVYESRLYIYYIDIEYIKRSYFIFPIYSEEIIYTNKRLPKPDKNNIVLHWYKNNLIW